MNETAREALARLAESGLPFELKNNGTHVIIRGVDFWPHSGLWICRRNHKRQQGVEGLIAYVKEKRTA